MVSENPLHSRQTAIYNFERARKRARIADISSRLRGKRDRLLPFDAVRNELRLQNPLYRGVQLIPLHKIVGSMGRYEDFTRSFLPLTDNLRERWVRIETLASAQGWPPIETYKVGELYFVKDGNHRTAVARQMDLKDIEAHVWEFPDAANISSADRLDDIIIKLGASHFTQRTSIDEFAPKHHITFTTAGRYSELLAQIEEMSDKLRQIDEHDVSFREAAEAWYELNYLPTVQIIRETGVLDAFPGRTEADLYVWLSLHRKDLGDYYGDYDNLADLARILVDRYAESTLDKATRQMRNLLGGNTLPPLTEVEEVAATDERARSKLADDSDDDDDPL